MTVDSKHDFHPDAESLNAFVEEMLGAHERGEIVAHLAECGRCRDVVFLTQEAAAQMEMVPELAVAAAAARSNSIPRRKRRFQSWRLAWVPVGALAVVVTVAYLVHPRRIELNSEVAKVEPATASQNQVTAAKPAGAPLVVAPQTPAAAVPEEPAAKKTMRSEPGAALKGRLSSAGEANRQFDSISNAAAGLAPLTARADAQKELEQSVVTLQAERSAQMALPRAKTNDAVHGEVTGGGLAGVVSAPKADAKAKSSGSLMEAGRPLASGSFAAYKATSIDLPSGLGVVSTASANRCNVAIDAAGTVFVSNAVEVGHWDAVAKQWSGRAVTVRLQPGVGPHLQAANSGVVLFELVNDQGQVWVSTNGRIWVAK